MIIVSGEERERFHQFYERRSDDECWPWIRSLDGHGYGQMKVGGRKQIASRIAYLLHYERQPGSYMVCHTCDNPRCVNPHHLWLGTNKQNQNDCVTKGRQRNGCHAGSRNANSLITEQDVTDILLKISQGMTNKAIAEQYGVTHSSISLIRRGKSWGNVGRNADGNRFSKYGSLRKEVQNG